MDGTTLTIDPTDDLLFDSTYRLTIPSDFIKDKSDNFYAGLGAEYALSFTTEASGKPPSQVSINLDGLSIDFDNDLKQSESYSIEITPDLFGLNGSSYRRLLSRFHIFNLL